jgi:hypothetical protein
MIGAPAPKIGPNDETMKLSALLPANNELLDLALPVHKAPDCMAYPVVLDIEVNDRSDTGTLCHRHLLEPFKWTVAESVVEVRNNGIENESAQRFKKSQEEESLKTKGTVNTSYWNWE